MGDCHHKVLLEMVPDLTAYCCVEKNPSQQNKDEKCESLAYVLLCIALVFIVDFSSAEIEAFPVVCNVSILY